MNTIDPNEKVTKVTISPQEILEPVDVTTSKPAADAPQPAKSEACEAVKAENLPTYHHHRSTALW